MSVLLEASNDKFGYADRVDIKSNNRYLYFQGNTMLNVSEDEYLKKRMGVEEKQPEQLKYSVIKEETSADRMVYSITVNRKVSKADMERISSEIFSQKKLKGKTFVHPGNKKTLKYREYIFFFFLEKQDKNGGTQFRISRDSNGNVI